MHYGRGRYAGGTGTEEPLDPAGRELLAEFERLGMILDVTHLSDTAFAQVVDAYHGPVFASHQNCRALVPRQRQFTDEQLKIVIDRGGIIGSACDNWMLSPVWPASGSGEPAPARESCSNFGGGGSHRSCLSACRQHTTCGDRQRSRRRVRHRAVALGTRLDRRSAKARRHPNGTRLLVRGCFANLQRQLAEILPTALAVTGMNTSTCRKVNRRFVRPGTFKSHVAPA